MATITSAQTGNWNVTSTWTGGVVPGDGDLAIIASTHLVTVTANQTIGDGSFTTTADVLILYGSLTINTGVTLTCKGDVLVDPTTTGDGVWIQNGTGAFVHDGDYRFRFDGSDSVPTKMSLQGTSGNRAAFSAAVGGSTYFVPLAGNTWSDIIEFDVDYCDLTRVGDDLTEFINNGQNNTSKGWSFDKCKFYNCGNIRFGSGSNVQGGTVFEILNSHFIEPAYPQIIEYLASAAFNADTRRFLNLTVIGTSSLNEIKIASFTDTNPIKISGVFQDCRINNQGGDSLDLDIVTRFKLYTSTLQEYYSSGGGAGSNIHDCYCYSDRTNPSNISTVDDTVQDCILETTQSDADQIAVHGGATIARNITIGGAGISIGGGGTAAPIFSRNTHINKTGNFNCGLLFEGTNWDANQITYRSNIVYDANSVGRGISALSLAQDLKYTDYNCFYQVNDHYYNITAVNDTLTEGVNAGFGQNDITDDPVFSNVNATVSTWDTSLGGAGTPDSAFTEMLKLNGFDASGNAATFDTNYTKAALLTYFQTAFTPSASALAGGGFGGEDIGAVAVAGLAVSSLTMNFTIDSTVLTGYSDLVIADLTVNSEIDAPALETGVTISIGDLTLNSTIDSPSFRAQLWPHIRTFGFDYGYPRQASNLQYLATHHDAVIGIGEWSTKEVLETQYDTLKAANPNVLIIPYVVIQAFTFPEMETFMTTWATDNLYDPEDLYLHYYYDNVVLMRNFAPATSGTGTPSDRICDSNGNLLADGVWGNYYVSLGYGGGTAASLAEARIYQYWNAGFRARMDHLSTVWNGAYKAYVLGVLTPAAGKFCDGVFTDTYQGCFDTTGFLPNMFQTIELRDAGYSTDDQLAREHYSEQLALSMGSLRDYLETNTGKDKIYIIPNFGEVGYTYTDYAYGCVDQFASNKLDIGGIEYLHSPSKPYWFTDTYFKTHFEEEEAGTAIFFNHLDSAWYHTSIGDPPPFEGRQFMIGSLYLFNHPDSFFALHYGSAANYGPGISPDIGEANGGLYSDSHWDVMLEYDIGTPVVRAEVDLWNVTGTNRPYLVDHEAAGPWDGALGRNDPRGRYVIAREYTNALVVVRYEDCDNQDVGTEEIGTEPLTYPLGGNYRRLLEDKSLGPVVSEITLGLAEGAILIKEVTVDPDVSLITAGMTLASSVDDTSISVGTILYPEDLYVASSIDSPLLSGAVVSKYKERASITSVTQTPSIEVI